MWSWNQFKNLPRNQGLSPAEQSRQYFIYQSNMMYESSLNAAAASAAAGAGGGTPASRRVPMINTDFLLFGIPNLPDDYMLFNLNNDDTVTTFETDMFYGPTVFTDGPDSFKYFVSKSSSGDSVSFGKMDDSGVITILDDDLLNKIGGSINNLVGSVSFTHVAGVDDTYTGLTGSTTGIGYDASFDIIVTGGTVSSVLVNDMGDLYKVGDTISISADRFGGSASQHITITVNDIKSTASPTSLYYEGADQFVYMDRFVFIDTIYGFLSPKIVRVNLTGTASLVVLDKTGIIDNLYPTSLFLYQGDTYAVTVANGIPIAYVGKYNTTTGLFDDVYAEVIINNIPDVTMSKAWIVISAISVNDRVYCNVISINKSDSSQFQCICELNPENGEAEFLHFVPLDVYNGEYLYTNITNYKL